MGLVLKFPVPKSYKKFIEESHQQCAAIVQTLSLFYEKGMLNNRNIKMIFKQFHIEPHKDLTYADLEIVRFHCENYYGCDLPEDM